MRKRISKYKHLHSNRFRYLSSSIPLICASGLLVVLGLMISPISSMGEFGVDGEVYALDWSSGDESDTGGGETGDTATPAVSMEFSEGSNLTETVGVTASTPTASSVKQLTITPQGSLEKYSIYVQTTSSTTGALVGKDKKETISPLPDATSTGGVALANIGVNQWGYALETGQKTADAMKYKGVSGSGTAVSAYDSATNPTSAQEFTLAFAANIGNDKPADHYMANVLVSVAANPGEVVNFYSVTYNTNNSTGGVTPATQTAESTNGTYTFIAPMGEDLAKTGYGFAGWSEDANATTAQYEPGDIITLSATSLAKILYAVWQPPIKNASNMFDIASAGCKVSEIGETKQLKDTRDGKMYWVTKLKDGNCWMTQNLDYDDPETPAANRFTKETGVSGWTSTATNYRAYYDPGDYYYTDTNSWVACGTGNSIGLSACTDKGWSTSGDAHYHAGNYYSWTAATNNSGNSITSGNATGSICPSGWQLPKSNTNVSGSFGTSIDHNATASGDSLTGVYKLTGNGNGSRMLRPDPLYFIPGGYVSSGTMQQIVGARGMYWSSTAYDEQSAYSLFFDTNNGLRPASSENRRYGFSVRCLVLGS